MANKRKKKNRHDIYSARLTFKMKKEDKRFLFDLCRKNNSSYSALVREALHEKYPAAFIEND